MLSALLFFSLLAVAWYGAIVLQPDRPPSMPSTPSTPSPDHDKDVAPVPSRTVYQVLDLDALSTSLSTEHQDSARPTRRVLILTPLMDAVHYLDNYFDKLIRLDYPQQLISLGFLVSTTTASPRQDPTLVAMESHISILRAQSSYRKITLLHQASQSTSYTHSERHAYEVQEKRRKALARCRNQLLISALMDESWVLWLDADVVEYSPRLMTELMALNKDIVVPNCFRSETSWFADKIIPYDRNNWFETTESMANQRVLDKDEVQFEARTTASTTTALIDAATGSRPAPVSAVAARRQQLIASTSKASTPEVEEHVKVDNIDVEEIAGESLDSGDSSDLDSDSALDSDIEEESREINLKSPAQTTIATPPNERRDRKVYHDPQSVSSFKPTRYNMAYLSSPGRPDLLIVGMKAGETIVFQGCVKVIPLIGYSTALGYIMSGSTQKGRSNSRSGRDNATSKDMDFSSVSTLTLFSPRTHALAVIESINLSAAQRSALVMPKPVSTSPALKEQLETLIRQLSIGDFDTVLAMEAATDSGIMGIEKVVPLFRGVLSVKQTSRLRGTEDEDKRLQIQFESYLDGFSPIFDPTDGIAALRLPSTWKDAMQALMDATRDDSGRRVKRPPVSVVCGGKKMGKSTFSRLLLNRMLSRYQRVAFIECDVGQSEFTPVGMVALHIVDSPALGPPFTHPRQPYRAFYVGNSTPRDDPEYYMACVKELVKTYYREVSHTRTWDDMDDDYHSDDDDDAHVPLIINTQGWIKGAGYDLLLQLLDYTAPSHIFGFHSSSIGDSNLPPSFFATLREQASLSGRPEPMFWYVASVALGDDNNISPFSKYHPADHRALALLSYFYLQHGEGGGLEPGGNSGLRWDFSQALVVRRPWCWDWSLAKGVWVLFDQVPPSQILHVLNASLVALIGDKSDPDDSNSSKQGNDDTQESSSPSMDVPAAQIVPPTYFPLGQYPPPPPEHTTCYGLAMIRSIQPLTRTFHILTPISPRTLRKCNGIVKGAIHMPLHASLDHNDDSGVVPGVAGVPWKKVPYLNYEAPAGSGSTSSSLGNQSHIHQGLAPAVKIIGSDAKVSRKNLGRKRLQPAHA
ncbi:Polynucleotide 5'-hydroxyl-kinase grc3 [Dissophora globulifera]|nr:Polynucleotide 5'-hydroxyl-kinase grc3 [Dissophora globulifera]